jgi:RNA polymerase sigma-70 factor (ECF subfamily)
MQLHLAVPAEPDTETPADEALVREARADAAAFGLLYERYLPRVYRYLYARTHDPDDAADLTQTVFVRALAGLPAYQPRGLPFTAWLFRIARNAVTDNLRRRERRPADRLPAELADEGAGDFTTGFERRETLERVRRALAELDPERRELLAMRFAGGLKAHEIAAVVGKSEAAVRKQLSRTISRLQERFDDDR